MSNQSGPKDPLGRVFTCHNSIICVHIKSPQDLVKILKLLVNAQYAIDPILPTPFGNIPGETGFLSFEGNGQELYQDTVKLVQSIRKSISDVICVFQIKYQEEGHEETIYSTLYNV